MMKFFRKHNKKLLAFFMVLLMIVFVGGSAFDWALRPTVDRVVATSHGKEISFTDLQIAEDTTRILDYFGPLGVDWERPLPGVIKPLETMDWVLLVREAKRLGMATDLAAVRQSLGAQTGIDDMARRIRRKPGRILTAMADYFSVRDTAKVIADAAIPSEAEILTAARKVLEKVRINAVVLPAEAFVDPDAGFTEEQIEEQYSNYRDREPGPGLEFGYYVPPAVKVQYIKIDRNAVAKAALEAKPKYFEHQAKSFYDEQRGQDPSFRRTPREDWQAAGEEAEAGEEALEGPPEPTHLSWEAAREMTIGMVSEREAQLSVGRLADWLDQRLAEDWLGVDYRENGYKIAPESVSKLEYYDSVLENVPRTIAYPQAISTGVTDFFARDGADDVPALGQASFIPDRGPIEWLGALAFRTEAIVPTIPREKGTNPSDYLASFQTSRYPLTDAEGSVYLFRVIDAREGHTPESVDEVRERVVADLRLKQAFEAAKAKAESLQGCGDSMTLQEAYESDAALVALQFTERGGGSGYYEPPPFPRANEYEAMTETASGSTFVAGGIGSLPKEAVERCFALSEAVERTTTIELPERPAVIVVEWVETQYADGEEFAGMRERFVERLSRSRLQAAISEWFDPDNVRARNGLTLVTN